jgi:hypothetical protein
LEGTAQNNDMPDNEAEKRQQQKQYEAVDNMPGSRRQQLHKKFHANVPAFKKRYTGSKSDRYQLSKHHDVNGTQQAPPENLCSHDIDAGDGHYQQHRRNTKPLKPSAHLIIELYKFIEQQVSLTIAGLCEGRSPGTDLFSS